MANVLTDLAADIYVAADKVGRELVGLIPSVTVNSGSEGAAVGQTVRSFATPTVTTSSFTPAMTIPEGDDQTIANKTLILSNQKAVQIPWTGEDVKFVDGGNGFTSIYGDQILQAMRAISNEIEADLATTTYKGAGNAYGTSGTTPFGSNFNEIAEVRKLLADRGCPTNDGQLSLVLDTAAGTNLRQLANLQTVNTAGNDQLLRQGTLLDLQGFMLKESAGIQTHTAGTGTLYDVDFGAGYSAGASTVHVDTGSGTVVAGDIITFSAGNNGEKSVINTLVTPGSGDEDLILNSGLRGAVADGEDVAILTAYSANLALHKGAVELAVRAPASPAGGDAAVDVMTVRDPHSGLVFEISVYKGFKKAMIMVAAVWGQTVWKPDFVTILQG